MAAGAVGRGDRESVAGAERRARGRLQVLVEGGRVAHDRGQAPARAGAQVVVRALEIVGKPAKKHAGINVAYRLISSLRFNPRASARKLRLGAGSTVVKQRVLSLKVRNRGNTVDPVSGSYSLIGPRAAGGVISAKPILPGRMIHLRLGSLAGLPKGRYRVTVRLLQAGRIRATVTRHVRLR